MYATIEALIQVLHHPRTVTVNGFKRQELSRHLHQAMAARTCDFEEREKIRVIVNDARVFTKRAVGRNEHYDLVMLDAFNGDYIPEHLMTPSIWRKPSNC